MQVGVLDQAAGMEVVGGESEQHAVADERAGDARGGIDRVSIPYGRIGVTGEVIGRAAGIDDHRTANGVAAVQGALRTLQHLDLVDIEQAHVELLLVDLRHAVHDDGDRRIGVGDLGQAAHHHEAVAVGIGPIERHVGNIADEVGGVLDARVRDALGGEDVDLDRDVLQALAALLGRHHHFLELIVGQGRLRYHDGHPQGHSELDRCFHVMFQAAARACRAPPIESGAAEGGQGALAGDAGGHPGDAMSPGVNRKAVPAARVPRPCCAPPAWRRSLSSDA